MGLLKSIFTAYKDYKISKNRYAPSIRAAKEIENLIREFEATGKYHYCGICWYDRKGIQLAESIYEKKFLK